MPGNFETLTSGSPDPYPSDPAREMAARAASVPVPTLKELAPARNAAGPSTVDVGGAVPFDVARQSPGLFEQLTEGAFGVTREHIGRYAADPGGELGRGGIGRVYVATDRHLERDVAVKELLLDEPADGGSPNTLPALVRFLREARITGRLEHPNIVPVYELGRRADGSLYYTMRVVKGRTLSRALADAPSLSARLGLVDHYIGLCQALAYAHSRGVVHRDIKPDNVMIGEFGETVVLDWGMAKAHAGDGHDTAAEVTPLEPAARVNVDVTMDGSVFGTPTHMSPEQARGAVHAVDERSDVWALGVVLYTILTGRHPFEQKTLPGLIHAIRRGVHASPRELDDAVPAELAAIAERALALDPAARYPSAKELLRDVEAYRSGARVGAYEYSSLDLVRRFLERHRTAVVASTVGVAVAMVLAVASYVRLAAARDQAVTAERRATENAEEARESERSAKESLSLVLVEKAEQALAEGDRTSAEVLASEALRLGERPDARGLVLAAESGFRPEPAVAAVVPGCTRYALALTAGVFACARGDSVSLYGIGDGAVRAGPFRVGALTALALSSDGAVVAAAGNDGGVRVFDTRRPGGEPSFERREGPASSVAVSADGGYVAVGGPSGSVSVRALGANGKEWHLETRQGVSALAFAPSGDTLVVGGVLGHVTLWDLRRDQSRTLGGHTGTVNALAFAQQGRYLASGAADRTIRLWDVRDAVPAAPPIVQPDGVTSLGWSGDGKLLASGSKERAFRILDLKDPERSAQVRFHDDSVDAVALGEDGATLVTASPGVGLQRWSLESMRKPAAFTERGNVLSFAFSPEGSRLVSAGVGSEGVGIFNVETGVCETRLPAGIDRVRTLAISDDGTRLAFAGSASRVLLWDLRARVPMRVIDGPRDEVRAVAFSHDGRWLASAGLDRSLRVVDTTTFSTVVERAGVAPLQALAFVPGSNLLVAGDRDGALAVWDVAHAVEIRRIKAHDDWLLAVAVSPDGGRIASAGADRRVRIWEIATGKLLFELGGHEGKVLGVAFSPDGKLLASASDDKSVRLWDPATGAARAVLRGHTGAVHAVHFAPGQPLLASAGDDAAIRLWRLGALTESAPEISERLRARYRVELSGTRVVRSAGR